MKIEKTNKTILDYNTQIIDALHNAIRYLKNEMFEDDEIIEPYREMLRKIYEMEDKEAK